MKLHIRPMSGQAAREKVTWQYDPPYDLYNGSPEDIPLLLDAGNRYFAVYDEADRLIGTCGFGAEARVAGGDYADGEPEVLDVGIGMHPGLVGQGHGGRFVTAILAFARETLAPERFRVTIAAFNKRSQRTFRRLGFSQTFRFTRDSDGLEFIQMEREAGDPG